jgi:Zn-dependent protease with chaperone function
MAGDFFERQALAKRHTALLRVAFAVAVALVVVAVTFSVMGGIGGVFRARPGAQPLSPAAFWIAFGVTATLVAAVILFGVFVKAWRLREGGRAVAAALGGIEIGRTTSIFRYKQLVNVVDEMAIAARIAPPSLHVLPQERGLNALAAGRSVETAALVVTSGALDHFTREELQAVVAHEFSHILNGDMALNTRMISWVAGLNFVTEIARALVRNPKSNKITFDNLYLWPMAACLFVVGSIGTFAARVLQAAISRKREELADASAVQFTRNAAALRGALLKIAAADEGSEVRVAGTADVAHLFFASADTGWASRFHAAWLRTHPPIEQRIQALDRGLTPEQLPTLLVEERKKLRAREERHEKERAANQAPSAPPKPDALRTRHTHSEQLVLATLATAIANDVAPSQALAVTALLAGDSTQQRAQLVRLAPLLGGGVMRAMREVAPAWAQLPEAARLPLLIERLPLIESASGGGAQMLKIAQAFARVLAPSDRLRFVWSRILLRRLAAPGAAGRRDTALGDHAESLAVVFSMLAQESPAEPAKAYDAGMQTLLPPQRRPEFVTQALSAEQVDRALGALATLHPTAKRAVGTALERVVSHNRQLTVGEAQSLQMISIVADIEMPRLSPDTRTPNAQSLSSSGTR